MLLRACLTALLLIHGLGGSAADQDVAATRSLTELLGRITTFTASFEQETTDTRGYVLETQKGTMGLEKPGRFRWQIDSPFPQLVVARSGTVYLYDPDLEQLTIQAVDDSTGPNPALLLTESNTQVLERFEISRGRSQGSRQDFVLRPRDEEALFSQIRLTFANQELSEIAIVDHLEQITQIAFENVVVNRVLESGYFEVEVPEGTDVIGDVPDRDSAG